MSAASRLSRWTIAICAVTALYWLVVFAATHSPVVPHLPGAPRAIDKVVHLGIFAGLAFLLCAAGDALGYAPRRVTAGVIGIVVAYAAFDELTQALVPQRTAELRDFAANMLGAGIGLTLFTLVREAWRKLTSRTATA